MDSPRQTNRRAQLQKLIAEAGTAADLSRLTGTPKTHISAILAGRRGIGDQLAAKWEKLMDKPSGWIDHPQEPLPQYGAGTDATQLSAAEPPPAPPVDVSKALDTVAQAVSRLGKLDRRQMAVLLPLLAEEPQSRRETCKAILRLLQGPA